ncbi:MAG: hypothetical protein ACRDSL_21465 [Pseudonocardiaceae bacterium]
MTMDAMKRWRAAVLAVLAAVSFGVASGCTDEAPVQNPGTEQEDGDDEEDDGGY